jgi:hypothetical protein
MNLSNLRRVELHPFADFFLACAVMRDCRVDKLPITSRPGRGSVRAPWAVAGALHASCAVPASSVPRAVRRMSVRPKALLK